MAPQYSITEFYFYLIIPTIMEMFLSNWIITFEVNFNTLKYHAFQSSIKNHQIFCCIKQSQKPEFPHCLCSAHRMKVQSTNTCRQTISDVWFHAVGSLAFTFGCSRSALRVELEIGWFTILIHSSSHGLFRIYPFVFIFSHFLLLSEIETK